MKGGRFLFSPFLFLILLVFLCLPERNAFAEGGKARLSLMAESKTGEEKGKLLLGLRVQLAPGWKTYWRSPGSAGYGLNLDWEGSKNIRPDQILWPLPHRFMTKMGSVNVYEGDVIFPLWVTVIDPQQPVHVSLSTDMLVCDEENCLPVMETLTLDLSPGAQASGVYSPALHKAMDKVPQVERPGSDVLGSLRIESVEVEGAGDYPATLHVVLSKATGNFSKEDVPELFLEIQDRVVGVPHVTLSHDLKTAQYAAPVYRDAHQTPALLPDVAGKSVVLTIGYQDKAFEVEHTVKTQGYGASFWVMMLFIAFAGGLILNIMPCVLPVLSLKMMSVMRHGGGHNATVRQEFLATTSGILFSFLCLASVTILLKVSGHAVGWGVQFQNPYFLIGLIGVLTLFSCNLFGFFEFRLPSLLSSLGSISPHRESLVGSFLEGSLVTVLATPCTAPFLGTALAFALSRGALEIASIFTAMGFGLSFPFLLVAFFPKVATKLPKPGAWMVTVKSILGFMVTLTILWLVWVLIAEIGKVGAFLVAALMLVMSLFLRKNRNGSEARKKMAWLGASLLIAATFALPGVVSPSSPSAAPFPSKNLWHPFEPDRIASHVKAGKTVLVSITADWCLTCQANKYFTLRDKDVVEALRQKEIVAMEADWTNHDPQITTYLKSFNQYGIPFYAIYGCRSAKGRFLGQLLTPQKVLDALEGEKCPVVEK